jgi:hypothetical protein
MPNTPATNLDASHGRPDGEPVSAGDLRTPPRSLVILYFVISTALFAFYAYTLWTHLNDGGAANAWVAQLRAFLHGH